LTIGASAAKALSLAINKPLYGVNHVVGHAAVDKLVHGDFPQRFMALVVSGGHSSLLLVDDIATAVNELGSTLDDAAGEAFDKVGRLLDLPYPGGPHIDRLAREGNRDAIRFPRALTSKKDQEKHMYDFSFSGLKTSVARWVETRQDQGLDIPLNDVAASFAYAVADVLTAKTIAACELHGVDTLVVGGGFSANSQLRDLAAQRCAEHGITLRIPPIRYCTDNGAMIAALGSSLVAAGVEPSNYDIPVDSSMPLTVTHV
jgi:N6-L-threonylcarbamoyladenine synthase